MEGGLVAERAKRLIPAVGRVHDRPSTLRALPKASEGLELEIIGALTLYWNVKDAKVTAVHIGKTERRGASGPLVQVAPLYVLPAPINMRGPMGSIEIEIYQWWQVVAGSDMLRQVVTC